MNPIPIDLHWHVFRECPEPDSDLDLWERSIQVACGEVTTRALSPADQLHMLARMPWWNAVCTDSMGSRRHGRVTTPDFDWDRVLQQASQRRLVLTMQKMLPYLRVASG
jgi:hypothetical protein